MTEFKSMTTKDLFDKSLVKLHMRCDGNTLRLDEEKDIDLVQKHLNPFNKSITFTAHTNEKVQFLDIEIVNNKTNIFHKPTNTGQYINFHSHTPWALTTAWTKLL